MHELFHILALRLCGVKIYSFVGELKGLVIEHEKINSALIELICILSGPIGGIIFSYVCSHISSVISSQWLEICSGVSLILSIFNLLPCKPLDGGRAFHCVVETLFTEKAAERISRAIGIAVGSLLLLISISVLDEGYGYGTTAAGICIVLNLLFEEGIVKKRELR